MLPPMCAWILVNGQPCNQFALRRRQFCRAHDKLARIEHSNLELREILDLISTIDICNLISLMQQTLDAVIRHSIAPTRAQTIFDAVQNRLTALIEEDLADDSIVDDPDPAAQSASARTARPAQALSEARCASNGSSPEARVERGESRRPTKAELEALLGPDAAGVPIPRGMTLSDLKSAMSQLNYVVSMNSRPQAAKIATNPASSMTSTLTSAK